MSIGIFISSKYKIDANKHKEITDALSDLSISRQELIAGL
jgi:hypothetical protein